jgi:hypothetical protein
MEEKDGESKLHAMLATVSERNRLDLQLMGDRLVLRQMLMGLKIIYSNGGGANSRFVRSISAMAATATAPTVHCVPPR